MQAASTPRPQSSVVRSTRLCAFKIPKQAEAPKKQAPKAGGFTLFGSKSAPISPSKGKPVEGKKDKPGGGFQLFGGSAKASAAPTSKPAPPKQKSGGFSPFGGGPSKSPSAAGKKAAQGKAGGFTLFGGGGGPSAKKSTVAASKPAPKKGGGAGGFTLFGGGGGPVKSSKPAQQKTTSGAGGFTLFGGGGSKKPKSSPPGLKTSASKAKVVKKLEKSFAAPSAKPVATRKGGGAGLAVTADERRAGARKSPRDVKKELNKWFGPDRALYLPGGLLEKDEIKPWLDGTLAGDYGFDPLELGKDTVTVAKYREFELLHARWAMLAVPGVVFPEALGVKGGTWFETGKVALEGNLNYTAPPLFSIENPLPLPVVVLIQIGLMGLVEKYRSEGVGPSKGWAPVFGAWDEATGDIWKGLDKINPGGPLNPFGGAKGSPADLQLMKVRELKNGRLAMIVMLGVFVQAAVTGEGPVMNWAKHIADPIGYNLTTILNQDLTTL